MFTKILIALCFAVLCVSIPLTLKLQPKVIEHTIERNIIVDSSVKGELEQKIKQWVKNDLDREVEKLSPQMQAFYRQKVEEMCKKKEMQMGAYLADLRYRASRMLEYFTNDLQRRIP